MSQPDNTEANEGAQGLTSPKEMRGQVAIVTGAGSPEGIGFAVAKRLHAAGLHVAITSTTDRIHQRAQELDKNGDRVSAFILSPMKSRPLPSSKPS